MRVRTILFFCIFTLVAFNLSNRASSSNSALHPASPKEEASVSFSFDGMEALFWGSPERVSVGILNVPNHMPKVVITRISKGQKSVVATLESKQLMGSLFVDVEGRSESVRHYYGASMENDPNDSRWLLDFNELYPGRKFSIKEESLWGKIHFSTGLFYADRLSEINARFIAVDGSGRMLPFNRRIAEPGAKINLSSGDALVIKNENTELLRLASESNVRYEIDITNVPRPDMAAMDHFINFYGIINESVTRYVPLLVNKTAFSPAPYRCIPVKFSQSELVL